MAKMELSAQEKKTLKSMFWNSGLVFCGFNMVKMEGNAFTCTMAPAIEELYSDPEAVSYTHLDVYKRQDQRSVGRGPRGRLCGVRIGRWGNL